MLSTHSFHLAKKKNCKCDFVGHYIKVIYAPVDIARTIKLLCILIAELK